MTLCILATPFGSTASNIFQGVGKGKTSLLLTIIRQFVLVLSFSYILGFVFNMRETGIYYGMVLGTTIGSFICYVLIEFYIRKLIRESKNATYYNSN